MSWLADQDLDDIVRGVNYTAQQRRLKHMFCQCQSSSCALACTLDHDLNYRKGVSCYHHLLTQAHHYVGVFPADGLPSHQSAPMCFIMNSDPASKPGTHWMAYYQDNRCCEFFDSYGFHPQKYPLIYDWLRGAPHQVTFLTSRIQGPNAYCGAYCYFYLTKRSNAASMNHLLFKQGPYVFKSVKRNIIDLFHQRNVEKYLEPNDSFVFRNLYYDVKQAVQ